MEIDSSKSEIIFSSGRIAYAHRGIIGISPELDISEGDDYSLRYTYLNEGKMYDWEGKDLLPEDKLELANHMINLWTKYRNSVIYDSITVTSSVNDSRS